MAQQICPNCSRLLDGGDRVVATITTRFVALKSSVIYALEKPENCTDVRHHNCQYPKGEPEGD